MVKLFQQFGLNNRLGRDPKKEDIFFVEKIFMRSEDTDKWLQCFHGPPFKGRIVNVHLAVKSILADGGSYAHAAAANRGRKSFRGNFFLAQSSGAKFQSFSDHFLSWSCQAIVIATIRQLASSADILPNLERGENVRFLFRKISYPEERRFTLGKGEAYP